MPTDQLSTRKSPRPADDAKVVRYGDFIDAKIQSTRRAVKLVDLASSLVVLTAGVLAFLLGVAIVEHWIVPDGFSTAERSGLFAILLVCVVYYAYRRLWPLVARAINPVYAASAIEQGSPALKNSLINFLLFRQRRSEIPDAVYRTLEEQAAQRLTRVHVDAAVDQSALIRFGYVLIAVVAIFGLYKVFSPKDPIVSAERVLMPWADIVPASRVSISAITPGSVTISRGEYVNVSAEVHGLGENDEVLLRYSSEDGQVVGKSIPLKPAGDGLHFSGRVTDDVEGAQQVGLTRNLVYRLEAGDARSLNYAIRVVTAPAILVERVDYAYPKYTGFTDRSVDGLGDIRAIEGTHVTVHARANGPIRQADVDFDADGRPDLKMTANAEEAHATFELELRDDRQTPRHASYVLRFTNEESRANNDPVKHSIGVERDQDPEAAILLPTEKEISARLDETVNIEIEARDPDFALSSVKLRGQAGDRDVLSEPLLAREFKGRFAHRFSLALAKHDLKAGDELQYWIEAADNRTPKPNTVVTEHKTIRITSPNPAQQPPANQVARNDRQQPQPGEPQRGEQKEGEKGRGGDRESGKVGSQNGDQQPQQDQKEQGGGSGNKGNADQQNGGGAGQQQNPGENQQKEGQKQQGGKAGGKGSESKDQNSSNGDQQSSGGSSGKNAQGSDKSRDGKENASDSKSQPGQQGNSGGEKSGDDKSGDQKSNGEQTGAGAAGGQGSKDARQPDGARPDDKAEGEKGRSGDGEKKNGQPEAGKDQAPVSSGGDNDGEAFERIQKHMERSGELSRDQQQSGAQEQKEGEKGKQGDKEKGRGGEGEKGSEQESGELSKDGAQPKNGASGSATGKSEQKPGELSQQQQSGEKKGQRGEQASAKNGGEGAHQQKSESAGEPKDKRSGEQSPKGGESTSTGPAGAGKQEQPKGSPQTGADDKKPVEKHEQTGSKGDSNSTKEESPSGDRGRRESDAQGDQGGDKTGGGREGKGQKSPRQGTGSNGLHDAADKGAGEAGEKGKGNTSSSGGKDAKSDHATGAAGNEKGEGSTSRDGAGDKPGGAAADKSAGSRDAQGEKADKQQGEGKRGGKQSADQQPGDAAKADKEVGKQGEMENGTQSSDNPTKQDGRDGKNSSGGSPTGGGGLPGSNSNVQPNKTGSAPEGDEANLEYARKQTDLVLEKLSDQLNRKKVDDHLLKELGWSQEDLRRFVERWQQRKDAAQRDDAASEAAKRELNDALRSLGLRPGELQQNAAQKDSMRDLHQDYRGPVPLEYQERLRAYNQGVSRAHRDGE